MHEHARFLNSVFCNLSDISRLEFEAWRMKKTMKKARQEMNAHTSHTQIRMSKYHHLPPPTPTHTRNKHICLFLIPQIAELVSQECPPRITTAIEYHASDLWFLENG